MLNLIVYNIKELLGHKKLILVWIVVSIIIVIGTCFRGGKGGTAAQAPLKMGVVNEDSSEYSGLIVEYFKNNKSFNTVVQIIIGSKEEIIEQFEEGVLELYLTIPEGFIENMMYIENTPIKVKIRGENPATTLLLKKALESYEKYITAVEINAVGLADIMEDSGADKKQIKKNNLDITLSLIMTALGKEYLFELEEIDLYPGTGLGHYYFLSILFICLFYGSSTIGLQMIKEGSNGTLNRMRVAGVHMITIILSKVFCGSSLLFIAFTIPYVLESIINGKSISILTLLFLLLSIIFCTVLSVLVSGVVKSKEKFIMVTNILGFFTIILGGGILPVMYLPNALMVLSKGMMNYWFIKGFLLLEQGYGTGTTYIAAIASMICILVFVAGHLYKRNEAYNG